LPQKCKGDQGTARLDEYIDISDVEIAPKEGKPITISLPSGKSFTSGYEYTIKLISSANNEYPTTGTKP
jgi:hypothetical protein